MTPSRHRRCAARSARSIASSARERFIARFGPSFRRSADFHTAVANPAYCRHARKRRPPNRSLASRCKKKRNTAMLPTVIYVIEALRRALKKSGRGLFIVADAFREAMHDWRAAKRKYPFAE